MKRLLVRVFALAVLGLLVTIPAWGWQTSSPAEDDPVTITSYNASFVVHDNGDLDAVETLAVDIPVAVSRHGIFQFFDTHDPIAPRTRWIPRDIAVTQDGSPATVDITSKSSGRYRVVRIGDPDRYLNSGRHVYRISYQVTGALRSGTHGHRTEFYWRLVPNVTPPLGRVRLSVDLPGPAQAVRCDVGNTGTPCTLSGAGTSHLRITAGPLAANTPVTLRAGLDMATPPPGVTLPWTGRWDGVLGTSVAVPIAALLLTLVGALVGAVLSRRAREANPAFPLQYAPPDGIGPAQGNYVRTERIGREAYVASVMQAAEKGALTLSQDGGSWTIVDTGAGWQNVDPVTQEVYTLIGQPKGSFTLSSTSVGQGEKLKFAISVFESKVKQWALSSGNLAKLGLGGLGGFLVIVALAAAIAIVVWRPFGATVWALVPGAFAIFGLGLVGVGAATIRTSNGRDLWSRVGGFHRVLSTPSSEARFDFSGRKELWTAYLPWAVAFGCADDWAKKYRTEMGEDPPMPLYYGYTGMTTGNFVDSMVGSFSSTVDSAISSYEATQSSSSSGGGGFSGGGGGGGGIGSW